MSAPGVLTGLKRTRGLLRPCLQTGYRSVGLTVYADLLRYRELFANLFQRELRVKFKGSVLGLGWTLVYPAVLLAVYTVVFSVLWKVDVGAPYPLFVFSGLVVWVFFSAALQSASRSLLANTSLIKKVRFPRQLIPLAVVGTHLVTLLVMLAVLIPVNVALLPETRDTAWIALPLALALVGLTSGLSLAVACLNVLYRDVEHLITALLLPWFFLTPILYTFEALPGAVRENAALVAAIHWGNFLVPMVEAIREPLVFGRMPAAGDVAYACGSAVAALALGAFVFRRLDDQLAVEL